MKSLSLIAVVVALTGAVACGGNGEQVPALETQTVTPPQETAMPERVQGCLRAGEAEGTFVLTSSAIDTQMAAATYELAAAPAALAGLAAHVGRRVEVTGTIVSEQTAQSRGPSMPAADTAAGTSGTPTVQSTTEVDVKRLQVASVTPVDGDCER